MIQGKATTAGFDAAERGRAEPRTRGQLLQRPALRHPQGPDAFADEAIQIVNDRRFGNQASIFTSSGAAARHFRHHAIAGNIGVNLGVAAPMAFFPFSGWGESFFGDLHAQAHHGVEFYTQTKVVVERWPSDWSRRG